MSTFSNRPNRMIKDERGRIHWLSRSVAVVSVVCWQDNFLILKRGPKVSNTNKWCVPCGYLDWNESASECAIREIWEESGLDLRDYKIKGQNEPIELVTEPNVNWKQDIAIHFKIEIESDNQPVLDLSIVDSEETLDAKWITLSDINNYDWAFNHDKRILKCAV